MSFDHCVSRRDTRQSLGGFHSFQLPLDASRLLDPPTRVRGILASNPGTSASYAWLIEHVLTTFLQGAPERSVICAMEDDLLRQGYETVSSIELLRDPAFLTHEVKDELAAKSFPRRRDLAGLRQMGRDRRRQLRELSLPSAMMEVPDSRFGDSFLLVSRRTREAYELGTGAGWRALQGDTTWVDHLAESILRLFSTEPEGGLEWASGYLYCFIDSLARFVAHQRASDLDVVSLDEAPDDIELRGSRYDLALARELQRVIAHNDTVLASIWGPDAP